MTDKDDNKLQVYLIEHEELRNHINMIQDRQTRLFTIII